MFFIWLFAILVVISMVFIMVSDEISLMPIPFAFFIVLFILLCIMGVNSSSVSAFKTEFEYQRTVDVNKLNEYDKAMLIIERQEQNEWLKEAQEKKIQNGFFSLYTEDVFELTPIPEMLVQMNCIN